MRGQEGGLPPWKRTWAAALSLTQPRNLHGTFLTCGKLTCAHVFPALVERSNPLLVVHAASMSWSERNVGEYLR